MAHPIVEGFRKEWPAAFAGPLLDKLSGNAFRWSTTQNRRSRGEIPASCFIEGRPTIVLRDRFLDWVEAWLTGVSEPRLSGEAMRRRHDREHRVLQTPGSDTLIA
jgi:hypothetical protein